MVTPVLSGSPITQVDSLFTKIINILHQAWVCKRVICHCFLDCMCIYSFLQDRDRAVFHSTTASIWQGIVRNTRTKTKSGDQNLLLNFKFQFHEKLAIGRLLVTNRFLDPKKVCFWLHWADRDKRQIWASHLNWKVQVIMHFIYYIQSPSQIYVWRICNFFEVYTSLVPYFPKERALIW